MGIENALIQAAQNGFLKNKVTEKELITMLEKDSEKQGESKKITVQLD